MLTLAQEQSPSWTLTWITMVLVGLLLIACGVAVKSIAERAASDTLGRNPWGGVRTKATMASDEAWKLAHHVAKRQSVLGGWTFIATGVLSPPLALLTGEAEATLSVWGVLVFSGTVVATVLISVGGWRGHQAARRLER